MENASNPNHASKPEHVFEYRYKDTRWYIDQRRNEEEFNAMIDRVSRITDLIEKKVEILTGTGATAKVKDNETT